MFKLILGPCQIESRDHARRMCELILNQINNIPCDFYFKSSYDKANRTSINSARGVGLDQGADILQEIKEIYKIKTLTDVHETSQCDRLKHAVDVLQIPAFLCRQTDLLIAAGKAVKTVNVKKGQFLSPWDMKNVVDKLPNNEVWLTERGTSFGYNNLVVDYRGLPVMRQYAPVIFDATHSVQQPGGNGSSSGGQRQFVEPLAKAAVAVGVDGLFLETHDDPDNAPSDGPNMIPVNELGNLIKRILQ